MGVRAKCSRCDYLRTFAEDLRGTYYRCPRCREGVIAVPQGADSSGASAEAPAMQAADETPPGAFFGRRGADDEASAPPPEEAPAGEPPAPGPGEDRAAAIKRARKKSVKVRRILVECALCGYHVAVPPELFGKTVHCPECRADLMFSESSLEPVKDEIIGRIALEHTEKAVLNANPVGAPIQSPEAIRRARRMKVGIVLVLTGMLAAGVGAFLFRMLTRG